MEPKQRNEWFNMFEFKSKFYFQKGLKISVDIDLLKYYLWHIYRSPHDSLGQMIPMYGAHISVILPLHGDDMVEKSKLYVGQNAKVRYSGDIKIGGRKIINGKKHTNYWLPVICTEADNIKKGLGIIEQNYYGLHLTISTNKGFLKNQKL